MKKLLNFIDNWGSRIIIWFSFNYISENMYY